MNFTRILKCSDFPFSNKLFTSRVYFKDTFTDHLLHSNSLHPTFLKLSVIKSQFMRIARKCTFKSDFDRAIYILCKVLKTQGYNWRTLRNIKYEVLFSSGFYEVNHISFGFYKCNL